MELKDSSRRDFLIAGLAVAAIATGCTPGSPFEAAVGDDVKPSGKKVKLLSVDGEEIEVDEAFLKPVPHMPTITNAEARVGIPGKKFVMVIDLSRCKNLKKCQSACNHAHDLNPGENWIKVDPMQSAEHTAPYWEPTTCMHCDEPPCVKVCPVDATFKRQDGIVLIDSDRCIGCRFCMAACPYSTRVFNWGAPEIPADVASQPYSAETSIPQKKGTVGKCDFCADMTRMGMLPHCVSACPNGTFFYGDLNEDSVTNGAETFRFSDLMRDKGGYRLMEDLGTKPSVYYLPPVSRNFPFESGLENDKLQNK
ncbi:4Fe-4S dicluster domain-containing protein [Mucilaginibacter sp.]|uniref:4Fe-4S dicluster domain-containing protein n=1 Tax=Mucilaginibacter sp. TaxID=1882438 RepID=UPI0028445071|nr:4Fe-4S dicluster domain-containing protein [Mucilaginibacter sp.]MDR3694075.1 4Fe-4S dicluster domain-containing protein [Mucilaginibacter sp.]